MAEAGPVLGVSASLTGKRWVSRPGDSRTALALAQRLALPEMVARALAGRGIGLDDAESFLEPTLRDHLPDPYHLKDMDVAAERIAGAIRDGETIGIFGDYDVDGATSSALLQRYIQLCGGRARIYIPDRIQEGYGPNAPALGKLHGEGISLVVTVDCGTTSFDALAAARDMGLDIIVVDHHEPEPRLPTVLALVNPKRLDEDQSLNHLATVGLAFVLAVAINRVLREAGWFANRREPDLMNLLDLVALGTVCDVVPLKGLNRAFVRQGLKVMGRRRNTGLVALADVAGVDRPPDTYHLGFVLGPRINAGGRVGESWLGATLLSASDALHARELATRLDNLNRERQELEMAVLEQAVDQVERAGEEARAHLVFAAGEGWHPGVIGIVASRLLERYGVPACVVAIDGDQATGSGRSVAGVDLGSHILAARQSGLLTRGGGHVMAAGFSCQAKSLPDLAAFLNDAIARALNGERISRTVNLDGILSVRGINKDLADGLERLAPFGAGNAEPRFALAGVRPERPAVVGGRHVRCNLRDQGGGTVRAIAFRAMDNDLGPTLLANDGRPLHLAGRVRVNHWQGRTDIQFQIEDGCVPQ